SGSLGACGLDPEPEPDAPPLLIITIVPWIVTPAGPMSEVPANFQTELYPSLDNARSSGFKVNLSARFVGELGAGLPIEVLPNLQRHPLADFFLAIAHHVTMLIAGYLFLLVVLDDQAAI